MTLLKDGGIKKKKEKEKTVNRHNFHLGPSRLWLMGVLPAKQLIFKEMAFGVARAKLPVSERVPQD